MVCQRRGEVDTVPVVASDRRGASAGEMMPDQPVHMGHQRAETSTGIGPGFVEGERQGRERGFQPVCEIGDVAAGSIQVHGILVEQAVQLVDDGPHLAGLRTDDAIGSPRPDTVEFGTEACQRPQPEPHLEDHAADQAGREQQQRHNQRRQDLVQRPHERSQRSSGRNGDPQFPEEVTLDPNPEGFLARSPTVDRHGSRPNAPYRTPRIEREGVLGKRSGAEHRVGRRRDHRRRGRPFRPQHLPIPARRRTVEGGTIDGPLQPQGPVRSRPQGIGHGEDLGVETAVHLTLDEAAQARSMATPVARRARRIAVVAKSMSLAPREPGEPCHGMPASRL